MTDYESRVTNRGLEVRSRPTRASQAHAGRHRGLTARSIGRVCAAPETAPRPASVAGERQAPRRPRGVRPTSRHRARTTSRAAVDGASADVARHARARAPAARLSRLRCRRARRECAHPSPRPPVRAARAREEPRRAPRTSAAGVGPNASALRRRASRLTFARRAGTRRARRPTAPPLDLSRPRTRRVVRAPRPAAVGRERGSSAAPPSPATPSRRRSPASRGRARTLPGPRSPA